MKTAALPTLQSIIEEDTQLSEMNNNHKRQADFKKNDLEPNT